MVASEPGTPAGVCDVHAHYLPITALPLMAEGVTAVALDEWQGIADNITVNGMPVGSTIHQLSSVDSMIAAMDASGVDHRVLSPPPFTYRYWADPSAALELCQLLNEGHADIVRQHPDRFSALCTVPLQDPDAATAEYIRATTELGLSGLTVGTNVAGGNLSDPALADVLGTVAQSGKPLLIHPDFVPNPRWGSHYLINLIGMPTDTAIALANLMFSGTLERIPDLRVCVVHGGGSLPYLLGRLRKGYEVRPESRSDTSAPPADQLGNVYFDSLTHSPQAVEYLVEAIGEDHVVLGTDAPFDVEDPDPRGSLDRASRLTSDQRQRITTTNPYTWLNGPA